MEHKPETGQASAIVSAPAEPDEQMIDAGVAEFVSYSDEVETGAEAVKRIYCSMIQEFRNPLKNQRRLPRRPISFGHPR